MDRSFLIQHSCAEYTRQLTKALQTETVPAPGGINIRIRQIPIHLKQYFGIASPHIDFKAARHFHSGHRNDLIKSVCWLKNLLICDE